MAKTPNNPVISNESAAILAGMGLKPTAEQVGQAQATAKAAAGTKGSQTRVTRVRSAAAKSPSPVKQAPAEVIDPAQRRRTPTLKGFEGEDVSPKRTEGRMNPDGTAKIVKVNPVGALNRQLAGMGVPQRVARPTAASRSANPNDAQFNEVGPTGADHFQAMTNLHNYLTNAVGVHEASSTPDYKGHFEAIRGMLADAQSDVMSAQGAHNQKQFAPSKDVKLVNSSNATVGNVRFNTRMDEGYQENYPKMRGDYGARNTQAGIEGDAPKSAQFENEPSSSSEYMRRAANGFGQASQYLKDLTDHISKTPSILSPGETPNTPVFNDKHPEGGGSYGARATGISRSYDRNIPKFKAQGVVDTSIVERFQPQAGSQMERLYPGATSRGRTKDVAAQMHQQELERTINSGRPTIRGGVTGVAQGPLRQSGKFFEDSAKPGFPVTRIQNAAKSEGPLTRKGKFFSADEPAAAPRGYAGVGPGQSAGKAMPLTPAAQAAESEAQQRRVSNLGAFTNEQPGHVGTASKSMSPYELARSMSETETGRAQKASREEAYAAEVEANRPKADKAGRTPTSGLPMYGVGPRLAPRIVNKQMVEPWSNKPDVPSYRDASARASVVPPLEDQEGNPIAPQTDAEEAKLAVKVAAKRHWLKTTGPVAPKQAPGQSSRDFAPILEAHKAAVAEHLKTFAGSPADKNPKKYLESKGFGEGNDRAGNPKPRVPTTYRQAFNWQTPTGK